MDTINCLGDFNTLEEFVKNGYQLIQEGNKSIHALPSGASKKLYTACPAFTNVLNCHSQRILSIMGQIIKLQNVKGNIQRRDNDEKFELLQEANDILFERINSNLDEMAGIRNTMMTPQIENDHHNQSESSTDIGTPNTLSINQKTTTATNESWNRQQTHPTQNRSRTLAKLILGKNIQRSQLNFKIPIDNRSDVPFEPRIKYKPNSIKPLAVLPEYSPDDGITIENYLHPYEFELNKFQPNKWQLNKCEHPQKPDPIIVDDGGDNRMPLQYIDTVQQLDGLLMDLSKVDVKEIAVDLEHHSYRTFQGFTCLLQISTRTTDYIIDTLALRDDLHVLNEIFTDPNKVKVFHGASCDIEWLQRDLSIYVVNLFDTHQAAKRLNFPRLSLAYLLKYYCNLDVDKTYQMADWRIRPLPEELLLYARQDTHYLLYIYDMLTNELLEKANANTNLLENVYHSSTDVCKIRYQKAKLLPDSHMEMYAKSKRSFDNRQLYALRELYLWRDRIARQDDESSGYVLPNHMLLQIAENLPREMQGILACCNPIPPLVRQHLTSLHQMILKARAQSIVRPILAEELTSRLAQSLKNKDFCSALYCPHDLSSNQEFRDDLPTLIGGDGGRHKAGDGEENSKGESSKDHQSKIEKTISKTTTTTLKIVKQSQLKVFDDDDDDDAMIGLQNEMVKEKQQEQEKQQSLPSSSDNQLDIIKSIEIKFVSPYSRYLAVLPFIEQQQKDELAKKQELDKLKKLCPDAVVTENNDLNSSSTTSDNNNNNNKSVDKLDLTKVPLIEYGKRKREWLLNQSKKSSSINDDKGDDDDSDDDQEDHDDDDDEDQPKIKKQFILKRKEEQNDEEKQQKQSIPIIEIKDEDDSDYPDQSGVDTNLIQMYVKRTTKELMIENRKNNLLKKGNKDKSATPSASWTTEKARETIKPSQQKIRPPPSTPLTGNQLRRLRKRNKRNNKQMKHVIEQFSADIQSTTRKNSAKKDKRMAAAATAMGTSGTTATPFDYNNVNFNKFKGGSAIQQLQTTSNRKSKGAKKQLQKSSAKEVNKLLAFSNKTKSGRIGKKK